MVCQRLPRASGEAGRRKYRRHGQTDNKDPGGQEDEGVIRERLGGGPSGLRIDVTVTLTRVLSSI
jgi:hypothetical protein